VPTSRFSRQSVDRALEPAKEPLAKLVGRALSLRSADVSASVGGESCLVLAPHPDDETLGCAVTIMQRLEAGSPVHVAIATDGEKWPPEQDPAVNAAIRRAEVNEAADVLGLPPVALTHLGFADSGLKLVEENLTDAISDLVTSFRPDQVLATDVHDPHPDHAALGRACRRALSGSRTRLLAYPIHQWHRPGSLLRTARAAGRPETVRTGPFLDRKQRAIAAFRSQLADPADYEERGAAADGLTPSFLASFTGAREIFFPVDTEPGKD
jgi:LmbE family N-acetylglucosaminyl deacetylase